MNNPIELWLKRQKANEATASSALAVMSLALGIVVLFLTFWIA